MCTDFYTGEDLGGGYKFSTNRGRTGEEHKVGFTQLEPKRKHRRRESSKQTNGASSKGISRQGDSLRVD